MVTFAVAVVVLCAVTVTAFVVGAAIGYAEGYREGVCVTDQSWSLAMAKGTRRPEGV